MVRCPKSHLDRSALLDLEIRKDPVAAIIIFEDIFSRTILGGSQGEVDCNCGEGNYRTAGKPYAGYLDGLTLQEENLKCKEEVAD